VFGLLFGVGQWLLGRHSWEHWLTAAAGGIGLWWAWPRALHPIAGAGSADRTPVRKD
jgi:hypothetical protein